MKRFFTSLSVIVAAMVTFAGCTKEEIKTPVSETKTVQFVAESIETKTAFGTPDGTTYPTLWTENDVKVKLSLNYANPKDAIVKEKSDDFTTAKFSADITDDDSGSYVFYALSPASAYNSFHKESKYLSATISTTQTPLDNSVDEAAQVLYSVSETYQAIPSTVSMTFKHFTAYGNLSFKNLNLGDAVVNSVAITSSTNIAGRWNYVVESGEYVVNSGSSTITLTTEETENLWFACAPVGSMEGETLTFTINTDKGTLSKTVTLTSTHKFEAGKIAKMVVDMADIAMTEPVVYELVTNVDELTPDSKVIIVAAESNVALSTTQNSNNRGEAGVTKSNDGSTIENPSDAVQILVIGDGNTDGTISFSTGDNYLYAPGGGNYLRSTNTLSENASWTIAVSEKGIATITANRENKNLMRYNATSKLFSCYDSGQKDISIYKLQGSGTVLENYLKVSEENIEVEADATSALFTVKSDLEWTATSENAVVTFEENTVTVTFPANEDAEEKVYTVTVSADGVDPVTVTITQKGKVVVDSSLDGKYWIYEPTSKIVMAPIAESAASARPGNGNAEVENEVVSSFEKYAFDFTFDEEKNAYTIQDSYGRYIHSGYYNDSPSAFVYASESLPEGESGYWGISKSEDKYVIVNKDTNYELAYDSTYSNWSLYAAGHGKAYPTLVKADNPLPVELSSIAVSGQKTSFTVGDAFEFDGTVTATYNDGSTKNVTPTSVSTPDMTEGKHIVTVTYDENTVSKYVEYTITVNPAGSAPDPVTINVVFSEYTAGTQYADNEVHEINDALTLYTTDCHFTTQLRIYSSTTYNGFVVSNQLPGVITEMAFNAGYKDDNLVVYGSTDGETWNEVGKITTTTSYKDYDLDFGATSYCYFKLDVEGSNQVRIASMSVTYQPAD